MLTSCNTDPAKMDFLTEKMPWRKGKDFKSMHESSDSHTEAVARYVTAPATVIGDMDDLLNDMC